MVQFKVGANYRLLNLQTGTYLTRADKDNVSIVGSKYNGESGQEWKFLHAGEDIFFIKAAEVDHYLAVPLLSVFQGQQLMCNMAPFAWKMFAEHRMASVARFTPMVEPKLNFDLCGANHENGAKIALSPQDDDNSQLWVLEEVRRNTYGEHQHHITYTVTQIQRVELDINCSDADATLPVENDMSISKNPELEFENGMKKLNVDDSESSADEGGMMESPSVDVGEI